MGILDDFYMSRRQPADTGPSFDEVRALRKQAKTLEEQRLLALEDRRAFAREYVQDNPILGPFSMALLAPAEQVYKGVQHLRGKQVGRSGFFAPAANIGAAYQGVIEGLSARGRK